MLNSSYTHIAEQLRRDVENFLFSVGLLCRVFGRGKAQYSLNSKINRNPGKYSTKGRRVQDAVGLRVVLYFPDDVKIVQKLLCGRYQWDEESSTIDLPANATFSVTRHNLVFRLPDSYAQALERARGQLPIDTTFEVQLRTVLSEGWHEVEHDLRYKCQSHWNDQDDLSRTLNGVVATLETAEWTMQKLFAELSYRHYKKGNWAAMLHTELRMRLQPLLSESIESVLNVNDECAKHMQRISRTKIIDALARMERSVPVNLDNIVHLWNAMSVKNKEIRNLAPDLLKELFREDLALEY